MIDSSPMYGTAESVAGDLAAELRRHRQAVLRHQGLDDRPRGRHRADGAVAPPAAGPSAWTSCRSTTCSTGRPTCARCGSGSRRAASATSASPTTRRAPTTSWSGCSRSEPLDFVQVNYSLGEREAERRILPLARERGIAVLVNRPFSEGGLVPARARPGAAGVGRARSAARAGLSSSSSGSWRNPAVTCVIPATSRPQHLVDNMKAGLGPLPDDKMRTQISVAALNS